MEVFSALKIFVSMSFDGSSHSLSLT